MCFQPKPVEKLLKKLYQIEYENINISMSEFQNGARKSRSIADHLFVIRSIINYYKYIGKGLIIEFLDLEKCFDKIWLQNSMNELATSINNQNSEHYIQIK